MNENTRDYWITRWYAKDKDRWHTSTMADKPTEKEAREVLAREIAYFYDDIEIELVHVRETVMIVTKGHNPRPRS